MKLSSNDQKILNYIKEFTSFKGKAPTLQEIKKYFGFKSLTSVQRSIYTLELTGYITKTKHAQRGVRLQTQSSETISLPLVGNVACGNPILAFENIEEYILTDLRLVHGNPNAYFYLRAQGDSMDQEGIKNNDLMLVKSQSNARDGEIVVALIDDSATVKKLRYADGCIILQPKSSNPVHKPIILHENFSIQGVVTKVLGDY